MWQSQVIVNIRRIWLLLILSTCFFVGQRRQSLLNLYDVTLFEIVVVFRRSLGLLVVCHSTTVNFMATVCARLQRWVQLTRGGWQVRQGNSCRLAVTLARLQLVYRQATDFPLLSALVVAAGAAAGRLCAHYWLTLSDFHPF